MTLPTTFEITLKFLSDWHVGTGQGRLGTIDAEVRRDSAALPFVPAKTLVGVWRDACETVAQTFDQAADRPGAWLAWVTWLFGSQATQARDQTAREGQPPVPATLQLTPAWVPAWLRQRVHGRPALAQAAVVLRPGVEIDDETGTAADRLLRVEERAIRGLRLHSRVSVASAAGSGGTAQLPRPAELLLRAGARLVEAVGGKRNRGSGRVAFLLPGSHVDTGGLHPTVTDPRLAELLAGGVPDTPPPPPAALEGPTAHPYDRLHPDRWRTIRVVLRVITPVVAADGVLSNVTLGRDSIPGTALLGTVLARAEPAHSGDGGRRGRIGLDDLRVGDAVPAAGDPRDPASVVPARPAPAVWHRGDKGRGSTVHNTVAGERTPDERGKRMSGWIVPDDDRWRHVSPAKTVSTHAVVDDEARRPTVASGGVYTYLGIAPGTLLCTDIVLPAQVRLRLTEGGKLRFGRSRKDDFGLVEVVGVVDPLPPAPAPALRQGSLRVWCVSDVLLRDERLAPDPSPQALARALSAALAPASFEVDEQSTESAAARRDGFGVAWGRPRPSHLALQAGSVVTLTVTGPLDPGRLAELERDGIGERTAEGYGSVRFNPRELNPEWPEVDFPGGPEPPGADPGPVAEVLGPTEPVHPLEINAWRRAIRRASAALAPGELIPGIDQLAGNRAQLGSLRTQLERLTLPDGEGLVRHWLEATRAVRSRRETWTEPVLDELEALLLEEPDRVWQRLGMAGERPDLVLGPGREDAVRQLLRVEALLMSITAALRRLQRTGARPGTEQGTGPDSCMAKEAR